MTALLSSLWSALMPAAAVLSPSPSPRPSTAPQSASGGGTNLFLFLVLAVIIVMLLLVLIMRLARRGRDQGPSGLPEPGVVDEAPAPAERQIYSPQPTAPPEGGAPPPAREIYTPPTPTQIPGMTMTPTPTPPPVSMPEPPPPAPEPLPPLPEPLPPMAEPLPPMPEPPPPPPPPPAAPPPAPPEAAALPPLDVVPPETEAGVRPGWQPPPSEPSGRPQAPEVPPSERAEPLAPEALLEPETPAPEEVPELEPFAPPPEITPPPAAPEMGEPVEPFTAPPEPTTVPDVSAATTPSELVAALEPEGGPEMEEAGGVEPAPPLGATTAEDETELDAPTPPAPIEDEEKPNLILLIEDDERIAKFYSILFQAKGFAVENARDGVEGVDMATNLRPALILLDVMMPKMNGLMVLQTLKAQAETVDTPVVVLSNYMEPPLIQRALQLGAIEYVVKSQARPEQLVNALPHWLKGEPALH